MIFETCRLLVRQAVNLPEDIDMYHRLWNHADVMKHVGFPRGLGIAREEIGEILAAAGDSEYGCRLVIETKGEGEPIGECMMGLPDANGVSETDVKLLPEHWNRGFGKEIKSGLVNYMFTHLDDCMAIKADPAKTNIASQRMQESVGAIRIERGGTYSVANTDEYLPNENHLLFMVFREHWQKFPRAQGKQRPSNR